MPDQHRGHTRYQSSGEEWDDIPDGKPGGDADGFSPECTT